MPGRVEESGWGLSWIALPPAHPSRNSEFPPAQILRLRVPSDASLRMTLRTPCGRREAASQSGGRWLATIHPTYPTVVRKPILPPVSDWPRRTSPSSCHFGFRIPDFPSAPS